jgi:hypothetical protein
VNGGSRRRPGRGQGSEVGRTPGENAIVAGLSVRAMRGGWRRDRDRLAGCKGVLGRRLEFAASCQCSSLEGKAAAQQVDQ